MDTRKLAAVFAAITVFAASIALAMLQSTPATAAPNLLTNPDFDTDIAGWTPFTSTWTWNAAEDSGGNPASGALEVTISVPGPINTGGVQCVPVTENTAYLVSGDVKMPSANQPAGTYAGIIWSFFTGADCTLVQFGAGGLPTNVTTADDTWHPLAGTVTSPAGAVSMWFYVNLNGSNPAGTEESHALYDNFDLSTVDTPTPTPTITNTPGPATSTPSPTNTSTAATATRTPTPLAAVTVAPASGTTTPSAPAGTATQPGGDSGAGVIGPPDTGSGPAGDGRSKAPLVALAIGGALLVAGWLVRQTSNQQE